jgi:predicted nucleic acid-binding protein
MSKVTPEIRKEAGNTAMIGIKLLFARYNPLVSRESYNVSRDKSVFNTTSEKIFQILEVMRWFKKNSKQFKNNKEEVEDLLKQFPELKIHQSFITEYVKDKRGKWLLNC